MAVSLTKRTGFENKQVYDYFISFHRNAFKPEQAGVETYTFITRQKQRNWVTRFKMLLLVLALGIEVSKKPTFMS